MKKAALNGLLFLCLLLSFLSTGGKGVFWMEQRRRKKIRTGGSIWRIPKKQFWRETVKKMFRVQSTMVFLTIDVDAQVESMEEQEEARWHQLLNAHRTRKICPGQRYGLGVDGRCRRKIPGRQSGAGHGQ